MWEFHKDRIYCVMSQKNTKNAAIVTIGCRLNQADTALMCSRLQDAGYTILRPKTSASINLIIINTCSVTQTAFKKSRHAVRNMRRKHPGATIVVTGCSTITEKDIWQKDKTADIIVLNSEKDALLDYIESSPVKKSRFESFHHEADTSLDSSFNFMENAKGIFPFKNRALVKIQEGCNAFCSYCVVPYGRGRERSRNWDEIMDEVDSQVKQGYKELVLTGVNICSYQDRKRDLADLLERLAVIPGDFRIRLSSTEPHPDNIKLLEQIENNPKICRFLHLPVQHGTNTILKAMNRRYTIEEFTDFAIEARKRIPDIHLGTDVIVGFPGETESLFQQCCDFVNRIEFANLHIFKFSPREGTPAATFPEQVPRNVAIRRHKFLTEISDKLSLKFKFSQINKRAVVLTEKRITSGAMIGWSDNYIQVEVKAENPLAVNTFYGVTLKDVNSNGVVEGIYTPD